jgi:flagellar basal body-associated protein FliL
MLSMEFICTNCGLVQLQAGCTCSNCNHQIDLIKYQNYSNYAINIVKEGYLRRNPNASTGVELNSYYSPDKFYEWLGMLAITAILGDYSVAMFKNLVGKIGVSIKMKLRSSILSENEIKMLDFINDDDKVEQLFKAMSTYEINKNNMLNNLSNNKDEISRKLSSLLSQKEIDGMNKKELKELFKELKKSLNDKGESHI